MTDHPLAPLPPIKPGDILLFDRDGFFGRFIKLKTWSHVSHVEIAISHDRTAASRNGIGCGIYKRDLRGLAAILRPRGEGSFDAAGTFNERKAIGWFQREGIDAQGYDWVGLLSFYVAAWQGKDNGKMFCSEFARRFLREGGADVFRAEVDSDCIAPSDFLKTSKAKLIWSNGKVK